MYEITTINVDILTTEEVCNYSKIIRHHNRKHTKKELHCLKA